MNAARGRNEFEKPTSQNSKFIRCTGTVQNVVRMLGTEMQDGIT
jgi:hypothetical protein